MAHGTSTYCVAPQPWLPSQEGCLQIRAGEAPWMAISTGVTTGISQACVSRCFLQLSFLHFLSPAYGLSINWDSSCWSPVYGLYILSTETAPIPGSRTKWQWLSSLKGKSITRPIKHKTQPCLFPLISLFHLFLFPFHLGYTCYK